VVRLGHLDWNGDAPDVRKQNHLLLEVDFSASRVYQAVAAKAIGFKPLHYPGSGEQLH
jgi:hypothetical protein